MTMGAGRDQPATDDLRFFIHTPESWARAIAAAALDTAANDDAFGASPVEIDAKLIVEQRPTAMATDEPGLHTILTICVGISGHHYCWGLTGD